MKRLLYSLVALGALALLRPAHAQGMTDPADEQSPVYNANDDNPADTEAPPAAPDVGEPGPASGAGADIPPNYNEDVGEMKNLPATPGLPEAHGPQDTSPGNTYPGPVAPPSSGY